MSEVIEVNNPSTELISDQQMLMNAESETKLNNMNLDLRYGFILGGYGLLIPGSIESEVINAPEIYPIPNTSEFMMGLISVRGHFAPVFDLGKMLDIEFQSRTKSIIVLKINGNYLSFPFEKAHSLELPPPISDNDSTLPDKIKQFAGHTYQTDQEFWIEFDFKSCIEQFSNEISHH